jgi:RHS repeat-associated protein
LTTWDTLGRRKKVIDTNAGTTEFAYDTTGHLLSETDLKGQTITRTYDALDRTLTKTISANGVDREIKFEYDDPAFQNSKGELTRVTSKNLTTNVVEYTYEFAYDRYKRQSLARVILGQQSYAFEKVYDPQGSSVQLTYPDGSVLKSTYATNGHLYWLQLDDATDGIANNFKKVASFSQFDGRGKPGYIGYGNGVQTHYTFWPNTGLLDTVVTTAPNAAILQDSTYLWTFPYNIEKILDNKDSTYNQFFYYDSEGRLTSGTGKYGARTYQYTDNTSTDQAGNLMSLSNVHFTYDHQRVQSGTNGFTASYDLNGNMQQKTLGSDTWQYSYDGEDRLIEVQKNNQVVNQFTYDFAGHRLKKVDADGTTTWYIGSNYEITEFPNSGALHTKYVDGPSGRIASFTATGAQAAVSLPSANQALTAKLYDTASLPGLIKFLEHKAIYYAQHPLAAECLALAVLMMASFLLLFVTVLAVFRAARARSRLGRLRGALARRLAAIGLVSPAWAAAFADAHGTMFLKRSTRLAYALPVALVSVLYFVAAQPVLVYADLAPGPNGSGYPVTGVLYFHHNHVNSAVLATNETGSQVAKVEYEPFGKIYQPGSSGQDTFRTKYGGHEYDKDSGLYYFKARYYDPDLGRFITPDRSVGAHPLHNSALNRYAYTGNNPINYTDPSGKFIGELGMLVGLVIAGVAGFLIGGTDGKILSDPSHAFDNWSWEGAMLGGFLGFAAGAMSFGLGLVGTPGMGGATLWGVPMGKYLMTSFNSAMVGTMQLFSNGMRDANRLGAYFGAGFAGGLMTSTGFFGLEKNSPAAGKLFQQIAGSFTQSAMKSAADPSQSINISLWAFNVTFGKDMHVDVSYAFLMGQGAALLNNFTKDGPSGVAAGWDWNTLSEQSKGGSLDWLVSFYPKSYAVPKAGEMKTVYSLVNNIARGILDYAAPKVSEAIGFDPREYTVKGSTGADKLFELLGPTSDAKQQEKDPWKEFFKK